MAGGRPSKLTKELTDKICFLIELGVTPPKAAEYAGCSQSAYYEWLSKARDSSRKNNYTKFMERIKESQGNLVKDCLTDIKASKDWRAKQWLLEHVDKFNYGTVQKLEIEHTGSINVHDKIKERQEYYDNLNQQGNGDP